jgi:hypothetical protein
MNRRRQMVAVIAVLCVVSASLALVAMTRVSEARRFSQKYRVQTPTGTNFVMQLQEAAVGRVDSGYVVIVYVRFENLDAAALALPRESFVLIDRDGRRFPPATSGTQLSLINLPGNGVLDKEALSYAVDGNSLTGTLTLEAGHQVYLLVKNSKPWARQLPDGQFVTFRSWSW